MLNVHPFQAIAHRFRSLLPTSWTITPIGNLAVKGGEHVGPSTPSSTIQIVWEFEYLKLKPQDFLVSKMESTTPTEVATGTKCGAP